MKKIIAVALMTALCLCLAACSGGSKPAAKNVDLKADGEPGYYACKDKAPTRAVAPKTGDRTNPWGLTALAFASAATAGYAVKRRRDDERGA